MAVTSSDRDEGCHILHVDMDAFYASVEVRRRPELRGKPVVVGGTALRGVVSSASYEARRFGIRSAMPTAQARARCPSAIFLQPDMAAYAEASRAVMSVFHDFTPLVEPLSVDEAFLDVTGAVRLFGNPAQIARLIRARISEDQQLTCSIGVAPNKYLAKLGSTRSKPDGLLVIPADGVLQFLHPLPVSALWGVGEKAEETLRRFGLSTVADVAHASQGMLRSALGPAMAAHLHELAWGRDSRRVSTARVDKSVGAEVTFDRDVGEVAELHRTMLALAQKVAVRARMAGFVGRTVAIKVRFADFRTVSRSRTLPAATDVAHEIFTIARDLLTALAGERLREPPGVQSGPTQLIRLIGVRLEGLSEADGSVRQLALGEPEQGWREAEVAADSAAARYGRGAVGPASLLSPKKKPTS